MSKLHTLPSQCGTSLSKLTNFIGTQLSRDSKTPNRRTTSCDVMRTSRLISKLCMPVRLRLHFDKLRSIISQLPETWEEPDISLTENRRDTQLEDFAEKSSYATSLARLRELAERRSAARRRVEHLRKLRGLLQSFEDPQENVQPNLVTRDGELAKELSRMRTLSARVAGRLDDGRLDFAPKKDYEDDEMIEEPPAWDDAEKKMEVIMD
jgi:hypothetical protein